jgi:hypothetical protein
MTRMVWTLGLVGVVLGASFAMPQTPRRNLDKNGTTPLKTESRSSQPVDSTAVAICGSLGAERAGFEPAVGFYTYAALAKLCYRPLSHLSGLLAIQRIHGEPTWGKCGLARGYFFSPCL